MIDIGNKKVIEMVRNYLRTNEETEKEIFDFIKKESRTRNEIAKYMNMTVNGVQIHLSVLQEEGKIWAYKVGNVYIWRLKAKRKKKKRKCDSFPIETAFNLHTKKIER